MTNLNYLSVKQLSDGLRFKKFTCLEIMQSYLQQIKQVNTSLNALVQKLDDDKALSDAKAMDKLLDEGGNLGPFHGVPISIKDHINVTGFTITSGSIALKNNLCQEDASIVRRLRNAGAIIHGISNMPELGISFETDNDVYGLTKNPYDLSKTPGGSSGGEAASIATGMSAFGIGSDAAGSIRLPAHLCGIVGLKPTLHLLPLSGNSPTFGGLIMHFATLGPMARYVEDLEISLPIISGWDGIDPYAVPKTNLQTNKALKDLKIGYMLGGSLNTPTSDTLKIMNEVIEALKTECIDISEEIFFDIDSIGKFFWDTYFCGGHQGQAYKLMLEKMGIKKPSILMQRFLELTSQSDSFDVIELRQRFFEADRIRMEALHHMQRYDILITPVCKSPAQAFNSSQEKITDFTYTLAFSLLGWPVCVVRCGETSEGLPIGIQVVAKPWEDLSTLKLASFLEKTFGGWKLPQRSKLI